MVARGERAERPQDREQVRAADQPAAHGPAEAGDVVAFGGARLARHLPALPAVRLADEPRRSRVRLRASGAPGRSPAPPGCLQSTHLRLDLSRELLVPIVRPQILRSHILQDENAASSPAWPGSKPHSGEGAVARAPRHGPRPVRARSGVGSGAVTFMEGSFSRRSGSWFRGQPRCSPHHGGPFCHGDPDRNPGMTEACATAQVQERDRNQAG